MRSSAPGVVGRDAAPVPSRFRGEAKALRGLRTHPRELAFGLSVTLPWDCPGGKTPKLPPASPARLVTPALTRPVATAPQIDDAPVVLDDLIALLRCKGVPFAHDSNHTPIHPHRAHLSPAAPQRPGSFAAKLFERGRASSASMARYGRQAGDDPTSRSCRCRALDKFNLQSGGELDNDAGRRVFFEDALVERNGWAHACWDG